MIDIFLAKRSLLVRGLGVGLLISCTCFYFLLPSLSLFILSFSLLLNGLLIYQNRLNKPIAIFYIFVFTYFWVLVSYFFDGRQITFHQDFRSEEYYNKGLFLFSFFLAFLAIFNNVNNQEAHISDRIHLKKNQLIFWFNILIFVIIIFKGKTGQNIFESGGYGKGVVHSSSINEYSIIFFLVAYVFSGGARFKKSLLLLLGIAFCLKNILFGGRIEVIQLGLMIFILFFEKRIKPFYFYLSIILGLAIFSAFSHIRSNPLLLTNFDLKAIVLGNSNAPIEASNQGDVFHSTVRMMAMVDTGIIGFFERIYAFILFLMSSVIPFSRLPALANLASYKANMFSTGGGGLIFGYFYVWFSLPGIVLIAYLLNKVLTVFLRSSHQVGLMYAILVLCTFPRWFAYIPINLIKLCLVGAVYYFFIMALHNSIINIIKPVTALEQKTS